jgi:hypothetical protein
MTDDAPTEVPLEDRPISTRYYLVAREWADLDAAAHIQEELKTTVLEQKKTALIKANPGLAENKAERVVKSSPEWEAYIRKMCDARGAANLLKQRMKFWEMRHREWVGANADARVELRLGAGDP